MKTNETRQSNESLSLSYTKIDNYQSCPLLYRFRYVLKVRAPKAAAPTFGQVVHETLQRFYERIMNGKKVDEAVLLDLYDKYWKLEGYAEEMEEKKYRRKGEEQLKNYYSLHKDSLRAPLHIERSFLFSVDDIYVTGKIDRIDRLDNGRLEFIDYKTGKTKSRKEVDKDLQMSIYAVAAQYDLPDEEVEQLSFYYLDTNEKISTSRNGEQIEETIELIKEVAKNIRNEAFDPVEGNQCTWCPYTWICPAKQVL